MNWRKWILISIIIIILLPTTGCQNRRELNKIALVTGIGIDRGEDQQIVFTAQVVNPATIKRSSENGSGQQKPSIIYESTGSTIFDAVRNLTEKSGRRLNYSHNMVIVIGENIAREGVLPILDFFVRDHEMRFKTWVVVTGGKAEEILRAEPTMENIAAKNLNLLLKDYDIVSKSVAVNILDIFNELTDESLQAVVGRVEIENPQENKGYILNGAAIFRRDKLVGWLDPSKTRGYLWVRNKVKSGIITVPSPGQEDKLLSLEIKKAKTSIKPYLDDGDIKYQIKVSVESTVGEQMSDEYFSDPETFRTLEDEQREEVTKQIESIVTEAQKNFKLDILGLGEATMRKFPKEWKKMKENWETEFPNADVEIQVDSKITSSGLIDRIKINK